MNKKMALGNSHCSNVLFHLYNGISDKAATLLEKISQKLERFFKKEE